MEAREFEEVIAREASAAGIRCTFDRPRRGHPYAVLEHGDMRRKVTYPSTPSDGMALVNKKCQVRRLIRELGATPG